MTVGEDGELHFDVFKVYPEYFLLDEERKYQFLLMLKEWIESEMDKL